MFEEMKEKRMEAKIKRKKEEAYEAFRKASPGRRKAVIRGARKMVMEAIKEQEEEKKIDKALDEVGYWRKRKPRKPKSKSKMFGIKLPEVKF